jgi:hypothetical protein
MAVVSKNRGDLQLDQLLQAVAAWLGISSLALLPSSSAGSSTAARWDLGMVRLVEVVLEPGERVCSTLATSCV